MTELLTTLEVARLLKVAEISLRKWRLAGTGPRFVKAGATVRYRADDVAAWISDRTIASTSEPLHPGNLVDSLTARSRRGT